MFILFPWDLNKLHFEVINLILYLLKVLLYLFILALIVIVNLADYYLGIAVYDHTFSSYRLGEIQPCYQSFVLCLVIGRREVKTDHAFDPIPFRAVEYHTGSVWLSIRRSIYVDALLGALLYPLVFYESEFRDEVSNDLSFYSRTWSVFYVEFPQLNGP